MFRFLKVMGAGVLVAHPNGDPTRYVGMRQKAKKPDPEDMPSLIDFYEPCEEILKEDADGHVRTAVAKGELVELGRCTATTMDKAVKAMAPLAKAAPKKGD
jgi:hypothetical protein